MAPDKQKRAAEKKQPRPAKRTKKQKLDNDALKVAETTVSAAEAGPVDAGYFRIVAGSYERLLYGIDAFWDKQAALDGAEKPKKKAKTSQQETKQSGQKLLFKPVFIFPAHIACLKSVAIGGHLLASGSADELIKLYDIKKRKELGTLMHHSGKCTITSMEFYGKTHMVSVADDGKLCIWRTKDWECLRELKGHTGAINCVSVHPSGRIALTVGADRTLRSWDLTVGGKLSATKLRQAADLIRWSPSGAQYAVLTGRKIDIYNVADAQVVRTYTERTMLLCMRYAADREGRDLLVVGGNDKRLRIYHADTDKPLVDVVAHDTRIKDVAVYYPPTAASSATTGWRPTGTLLVTASSSGHIRVWDLEALLTVDATAAPEVVAETALVGEHDTGSRLTCTTVCNGFEA